MENVRTLDLLIFYVHIFQTPVVACFLYLGACLWH